MKKAITTVIFLCTAALILITIQPTKKTSHAPSPPAVTKRGYNVLRQVISKTYEFEESDIRKKHPLYPQYNFDSNLEDVISASHALMDMAEKEAKRFDRGSFSLVDTEAQIYDFFLDYVKQKTKNCGWKNIPTYQQVWKSYCPAYSRTSSHYKKSCTPQYGIDIYDKILKKHFPVLPSGKRHILFGRIALPSGNLKTFVKFERSSMGSLKAAIIHALHWFYKRIFAASAHSEVKSSERSLPAPIKIAYKKLFSQKPKKVAFHQLGPHIEKHLQKKPALTHKTTKKAHLMQEIKKMIPKEGTEYREGNEVVLNPAENFTKKE